MKKEMDALVKSFDDLRKLFGETKKDPPDNMKVRRRRFVTTRAVPGPFFTTCCCVFFAFVACLVSPC